MLLTTVLSTAVLCAVFALLPARLPGPAQGRPSARADAAAWLGTFVFTWAAALCIYSKPGLGCDFSLFRMMAICLLAAWAGACVCGVRLLRRRTAHRLLGAAGLVLLAALGTELLLCNAPFYATHDLPPPC